MDYTSLSTVLISGSILLTLCPWPTHGQADTERVSRVEFRPPISTSSYVAGKRATFVCWATGGSPQPEIKWLVGTERVRHATETQHRKSDNVRGTLDVTMYREMDGKPLICEADNGVGRPRSVNTTLIVQYPPYVAVVYDQSNKTAICTAHGNPSELTFKGWYRRLGVNYTEADNDIESILQLKSIRLNSTTWVLPLPEASYNDIGYYGCKVSNELGDGYGEDYVQPWGPPLILEATSNYTVYSESNMTIDFSIYSSPPIVQLGQTSSVPFQWTKDGVALSPTYWDTVTTISFTNLSIPVRGSPVQLQGQAVKIHVTNVTMAMAGHYSLVLTARTGGSSRLNFSLQVVYEDISTTPSGPIMLQGGLGAGIIVLIVVVVINVIVCLGVFYWRSRKVSQRNKKGKLHGRPRETVTFLPVVSETVSSLPPTPPRRTTSAGRVRPKAKQFGGSGHYAELDFDHINKSRKNNQIVRKDPPTEYAWIDFSHSNCSPGAS